MTDKTPTQTSTEKRKCTGKCTSARMMLWLGAVVVASLLQASSAAQDSRSGGTGELRTPNADETIVFYDYPEDGRIKGGAFITSKAKAVTEADIQAMGVWPSTTLINNGPAESHVDIVFLGDGYTAAELDQYADDVNLMIAALFSEEPLDIYASYFNVHRVDVTSNESGVDEPDLGIYKDTALDATFNCNGVERALCVNTSKTKLAAASAPARDQIIVLVNSSRYGGVGYMDDDIAVTAAGNEHGVEVMMHEFGHTLANLGDEYNYGGGEQWTGGEVTLPNVSIYDADEQLSRQTKWYRWLGEPNVWTYEGANYYMYGIYRPTDHSKMNWLYQPFEQVNIEQFVIRTSQIASTIYDATPYSQTSFRQGTTFFATPMQPADHTLNLQWSVDDVNIPGATGPVFTPDVNGLGNRTHAIKVTVADNTSLVRNPSERSTYLTDVRQWLVNGPIQEAMDAAPAGASLVIPPGTYYERLNFKSKKLTLTSQDPNDPCIVAQTVIDGSAGGSVVTFSSGEDANCVLAGLTITDGNAIKGGGIYCSDSSPTITDCRIIGNAAMVGGGIYNLRAAPAIVRCRFIQNSATTNGGAMMSDQSNAALTNCLFSANTSSLATAGIRSTRSTLTLVNCTFNRNVATGWGGAMGLVNSSTATLTNCILWGDSPNEIYTLNSSVIMTYGDVQGGWQGLGNIASDPLFADANNGDYHLMSTAGRWDDGANGWVQDANTSRCIDSGHPGYALADEPDDGNNVRINMGVYGGTSQASKTPLGWALLADLNNDGVAYLDDLGLWADYWLNEGICPADLDVSNLVDAFDFALLAEDWGLQTVWK